MNTDIIHYEKPVLGFAAYSGTGKTTLLCKLIPALKQRGLRIAVIKHAHHNFDMDTPGKDSYVLREAGALPMIISSSYRTVITLENEIEKEPELNQLLQHIPLDSIDMVLVEGFKKWPFKKIELHRAIIKGVATTKDFLYLHDEHIIAIAHDSVQPLTETTLPQLNINDVNGIADFIIQNKQIFTLTPHN